MESSHSHREDECWCSSGEGHNWSKCIIFTDCERMKAYEVKFSIRDRYTVMCRKSSNLFAESARHIHNANFQGLGLESSLDRTLWRFARTRSVVSAWFTSFARSHLIGVRQMPQSRHSLTVVPAAPFPG